MRPRWSLGLGVLFLALGYCDTALADFQDRVELHGFGSAGYLQTSGNKYLSADSSGTWDHYAAALLLTGTLADRTKLWGQVFTGSTGPNHTHLDWLFIDYHYNSNLALRAGRVKLPMGLYNEIREAEFLQLSAIAPMVYQVSSEIADEAFEGASLVFDHDLGGGSMSWDVFTGKTIDDQSAEIKYQGLRGGRITYNTPIEGLRFMASGHWENVERVTTAEKNTETTTMFSADFVRDNFDLKSEYAHKATFGIDSNSGYFQAGYTIAEKWTPYFRSDFVVTDISQSNDPSYYQRSQVVGLGYKVNKQVGLRVESHFNHGYGLPVASGEVAAGAGVIDWRILAASVNSMF